MASASKYFARAVAELSCADLVHERRSCAEAAVWNCTRTIVGCCRYVLPIAIVRTRDGGAEHANETKTNTYKTTTGSFKFSPIAFAQLPVILKIGHLNRSVVRESAAMFVEYALAAWLMGSGGLTMMCIA